MTSTLLFLFGSHFTKTEKDNWAVAAAMYDWKDTKKNKSNYFKAQKITVRHKQKKMIKKSCLTEECFLKKYYSNEQSAKTKSRTATCVWHCFHTSSDVPIGFVEVMDLTMICSDIELVPIQTRR